MLNFGKSNKSYIKFGGWDQNSIAEGSKLSVFKTPSQDKWALAVSSIRLNAVDLSYYENEINIKPELRYLYLPADEFWSIQAAAQSALKDAGSSIHMRSGKEAIRFDASCDQMKNEKLALSLKLEITDSDQNSKTLEYDLQ